MYSLGPTQHNDTCLRPAWGFLLLFLLSLLDASALYSLCADVCFIYLFTCFSPQRTSWLLNWAFVAWRLCNKDCLIPPAVKREAGSFWELHCEPFDYLPQLQPAALKKCECAVVNGALCFALLSHSASSSSSFSFLFFFFFVIDAHLKNAETLRKIALTFMGNRKQPSGKLAIFPLGVNSKKINIYEKQ